MQELENLEKEESIEYNTKGLKFPPSFCFVVHKYLECECDNLEDISDIDHEMYICKDCGNFITK